MLSLRLRAWPRRIAAVLVAAGVALLAAELFVRRFFPVDALIYTLDPVLLHRTIPGSRHLLLMDETTGGGRVLVLINSDGFRGPELRAGGSPRVAVYGDSFVMAENVPWRETFVARLAAELSEALDVEVEGVNAGASGYGPDQVLLRMERELDQLEPELVVLVLCAANDMGDLLRNKLFGIGPDGQLVRREVRLAPELVERERARQARASRPALVRASDRLLRQRALEARLGQKARGGIVPPYIRWYLALAREEHEELQREEGVHEVRTLFQDVYDADVAIHPEWPSARSKRALLTAVLGRIAELCRARGLPLLAVVAPVAVDLDPDFRIRVDPAAHPTYDPRRLSATCAAALEQAGIPHVELHEAFAAAGASELFEGWEDIHWNARGQQLAARRVAERILAEGWLAR